jgi:hypothetical protein
MTENIYFVVSYIVHTQVNVYLYIIRNKQVGSTTVLWLNL